MNKDKKPLSETHPELAKEAHGWDPKSETAGSGKKLEWKCKFGHIWSAKIANRSLGRSCPICTNKKVLTGFNDLATKHPELAKEAHGWNPTTVIAGTGKKLEWKCKFGHIWSAVADSRTRGTGCPICSNNLLLTGFNDLATKHPELAKEAHGWDPTTVIAGTGKKLEWKCKFGHIWSAVADSRIRGRGCPICSNQKVLSGFNDLATKHPELAKEAHGWDPTTVTSGTDKKFSWKCISGHTWNTSVNGRTSGRGCPICSNHEVLSGFNDLATKHPELAKEAHGWDPTTVNAGSSKKLEWKCKFGHNWSASVANRFHGNGCPICSNQKVLSGFNDLASTHPELAKEAHGWDPTTVTAGTHKKLEWKCKFGHFWETTGHSRVSGLGCPTCSNFKVLRGFNDLASTHPELAKEAHGWDPTTVIAGQRKKLTWKCKAGHTWTARSDHRSNGIGCPSCAASGFDPNQDGYLYFLIHPKWEMFQIGITNFPKVRLNTHSKIGFELLELRGPMDGHSAQELETALLRFLKSQKADLSPEHVAGKFDGYSECWTIDSYKVNNLKELIDKASEAGF